jgi:hypothetical protein
MLGLRSREGEERYGAFSKYLQSMVALMSILLETRKKKGERE